MENYERMLFFPKFFLKYYCKINWHQIILDVLREIAGNCSYQQVPTDTIIIRQGERGERYKL